MENFTIHGANTYSIISPMTPPRPIVSQAFPLISILCRWGLSLLRSSFFNLWEVPSFDSYWELNFDNIVKIFMGAWLSKGRYRFYDELKKQTWII